MARRNVRIFSLHRRLIAVYFAHKKNSNDGIHFPQAL